MARALKELHAERLDESAALLAHHHEQAGAIIEAARWHRRAAEWMGMKDIKAALHHWQRVRELARQGDDPESTALTIAACSQALAYGWWMGSSAAWVELFEEGCAAAERAGDLAGLSILNTNYSSVAGHSQGSAPAIVRYAGNAVQIAESTGDDALLCGTLWHLCVGHVYAGNLLEAERAADRIIDLAREDPHLGTYVSGINPLFAAQFFRHRCIGFKGGVVAALSELPRLRQLALDRGYPEQALWSLWAEAELKYTIGNTGISALAQSAARLAEHLGVGNQIVAAHVTCDVLASEHAWQALLNTADDALRLIRERGVLQLHQTSFFAHLGVAHFELGNIEASRAAADAGVAFMRTSECALMPRCYAVLARAQLALDEPVTAIAATLDEYAALLEQTGFHLFEGELHELRAQLAEREGFDTDRIAALQCAHLSYARFGMIAQAERVALSL